MALPFLALVPLLLFVLGWDASRDTRVIVLVVGVLVVIGASGALAVRATRGHR